MGALHKFSVRKRDPSKLIESIEFFSAQPAFEIDDVASATPEPATWLTMILGFGLVGAGLRRRRAKVTFAAA